MSKDRRRARAARQDSRRRELETAAETRARAARRADVRSRLRPSLPRRRRRYNSLSTRQWAQLVVAFVAVQVVAWLMLAGIGQRGAVAILTLACLLVMVRTRRRPAR